MKKHNIILILALILVFLFSSVSYAIQDKSILILLDELDLANVEETLSGEDFGIGFMNLRTRRPYNNESLYFSIGTGRKVGVKSEFYKGLYKNKDGTIKVVGFENMLKDLTKRNNNIELEILGDRLKYKGLSYIGDNSSAIVAADKNGNIKYGEIEIKYDEKWLMGKTNFHLSDSNILVLSYEIAESKYRADLLKRYIDKFRDYNIIIIPNKVSDKMRYILNKNLAPVIYLNGDNRGLIKSSSTKREGFITIEDIFVELLSINGEESFSAIGNRINIIDKENNLAQAKNLFKKTINLIWITSIFHGIVYFIQAYSAYYIYKNKKEKFDDINIYNNFIVINILISLLMGASSLHINIVLYLFINMLTTYIITMFISDKDINTIGLFSTLTYILIIFGILFYPEIIYNSYIGFNNLFYGARYYGFNNGIMGVLLVTSIISYFFVKDLIPNKFIDNLVCLLYFSINMVVLSSNYGANTGGFLTSVVLFLIMAYTNLLGEDRDIKNILLLILIGLLIFSINMYFDYFSNEKSHAIDFLVRIKNFGISEFVNMFKIKVKELIKFTLLPPFSIVIVSQIISLKSLLKIKDILLKREIYIIFITGIIGFILNDTGMITFIYMVHYLISLLIYFNIENSSRI